MINNFLGEEHIRQQKQISLIASENYPSAEVRKAVAGDFIGKYCEGYPNKRYYAGNKIADKVESLVCELSQKFFNTNYHVNAQALSGSIANLAVYTSVLQPGDIIMSLDLAHGGHLSHGHDVTLVGKLYERYPYYVNELDGYIDYDALEKEAIELRPKMIVSGATAYPRIIDFERIADICKKVGALHLADISHISGLVGCGLHPSPFNHADFVMTTTHKILRGARGALIFCQDEYAKQLDKAVFPGLQGGPHMNNIAGIGVALEEALQKDYLEYCKQIIKNARALAEILTERGLTLVTGGTDNHLLLIDLRPLGIDGSTAQDALEAEDIITNRNTIPYDELGSAMRPNGLRLGTPAITTRGYKESDCKELGNKIADILLSLNAK